ncbi:MAG: GNAT family N-acetyltransferase [Bacilli bacterium]|nr:GNAT family N-acetyltransferase [Bacilli bacterium]MBN2877535.1 GNAT family N-acetyltransferase [Bacilli bacterium]
MKFLKDNQVLEIAEATKEDAEELLEFLKQVGKESENLILDGNGLDLTIEQERKLIEQWNQTYHSKEFVGKVDDKIICSCGIRGSNHARISHNVSLGISVLKDYWNKGVATHLLNHVLNYCRMEKQIENVTLEVRPDNQYAVKLYKSLGFQKIGTFHNKVKIDGKGIDEDIYELRLK